MGTRPCIMYTTAEDCDKLSCFGCDLFGKAPEGPAVPPEDFNEESPLGEAINRTIIAVCHECPTNEDNSCSHNVWEFNGGCTPFDEHFDKIYSCDHDWTRVADTCDVCTICNEERLINPDTGKPDTEKPECCFKEDNNGKSPEETQWPCDTIECSYCKFYRIKGKPFSADPLSALDEVEVPAEDDMSVDSFIELALQKEEDVDPCFHCHNLGTNTPDNCGGCEYGGMFPPGPPLPMETDDNRIPLDSCDHPDIHCHECTFSHECTRVNREVVAEYSITHRFDLWVIATKVMTNEALKSIPEERGYTVKIVDDSDGGLTMDTICRSLDEVTRVITDRKHIPESGLTIRIGEAIPF